MLLWWNKTLISLPQTARVNPPGQLGGWEALCSLSTAGVVYSSQTSALQQRRAFPIPTAETRTRRLFQTLARFSFWSLINWRNKKKKIKAQNFKFFFSRHFIHLQTSSPKTLFIHESKQQVFCHHLLWKRADFPVESPPSCKSENVSSATSRNDFCVCMKNLCSSVISSDGFY